MISSSEGCRIISGGKKGHVQGQKLWETLGPLSISLCAPKIQALQESFIGGAEVHSKGMASYLCTSWHWGYGLAWCPAHPPQRS